MNKFWLKMPAKPLFLILGGALLSLTAFLVGREGAEGKKSERLSSPLPAISLAKKEINREFSLELKDKERTKIAYLVESAELVGEISVRGERVKAAPEKTFLIFNLKINNNGKQGIQINSRNFVRLSLPGKEEWLAPEIHNDPVEVQAIATKYTRIGFSVNRSEKQFKVRLGEIGGDKVSFDLFF